MPDKQLSANFTFDFSVVGGSYCILSVQAYSASEECLRQAHISEVGAYPGHDDVKPNIHPVSRKEKKNHNPHPPPNY